jgi:hypothetical protein
MENVTTQKLLLNSPQENSTPTNVEEKRAAEKRKFKLVITKN